MLDEKGSDAKQQYLQELERRHTLQKQNSHKVANTEKLDDDGLRRLDSTLKKTTAFMKKIRNIGTASTPAASLMSELEKLNLSKFLDELAASIADAKIKSSDIADVVDICVFLSSRYKTFPENLISELRKSIPCKRTEKITNPSKLRVDIRFLVELVLNGVFASGKDGLQLLGNALACVMATDKTEHVNIAVILPLCKSHAIVDITDLVPSTPTELGDDLPRSSALTSDQRRTMGQLFRDYMQSLVEHANKVRVSMNKVHRHIKKQERTRGDASNEDRLKFDELKAQFLRLYQNGRELGECLGITMPPMAEEPSDDEEELSAAVQLSADIEQGRVLLWPDDDTRRFYENLHEFRQAPGAESLPGTVPTESALNGAENRRRMDEFLDRLANSINREMIDRAAQEFASELYQSKRNKKRLSVYMIDGAPKNRLDLLPFLARFLATIHQVYPEYVNDICKELLDQFKEYAKLGGKNRLDCKMYVVYFTGELIKFGVISQAEALNCLRMLMSELKQSNVDLFCCLIESCGSFLYKSPESHSKMKILLELMGKKKENVKDPRHQILLDNAYYAVIPPEESTELVDTRLPVEKAYMLKLLNQKTNRVAALRKIDWADDDIGVFAIEAISDPTNIPFESINQLAQCVAALSQHHDWLVPEVLDNVLERIRLSLEIGILPLSQKTVADIIYLANLYIYEMCDSKIVMQVLYQLISFNVATESPRNLRRIHLVHELLLLVSEYFKKGARRRKLDAFLPYFYRFYWAKKEAWLQYAEEWGEFPRSEESYIVELLQALKRNDFPESLESANKMVEKLERIYRSTYIEAHREQYPEECNSTSRCLDAIIEENDEIEEETDTGYEEEDEEEEEADKEQDNGVFDEQESEQDRDDEDYLSDTDDEAEHIHTHTDRQVQPEDEQFINDLDRMLNEAYTTAPMAVKAPAADLTIPTSAIKKLDRKISFQKDVSFPGLNRAYEANESPKPEKMKMALLARGKGNKTVLKAVSLDTPKNLEESWRMRQAQRDQERSEMKKLTLKMSERIMDDDEADHSLI